MENSDVTQIRLVTDSGTQQRRFDFVIDEDKKVVTLLQPYCNHLPYINIKEKVHSVYGEATNRLVLLSRNQ